MNEAGKREAAAFINEFSLADCRKFKAQAEARGIAIDYHEYEDIVHVWTLIPSPEERKAAKAVAGKIRGF